MKKLFTLILLFCIFAGGISAQTPSGKKEYVPTHQTAKKKAGPQTEVQIQATGTPTDMVYKGKPVYKGSKGGFFVVVPDKKNGGYKRSYLPK